MIGELEFVDTNSKRISGLLNVSIDVGSKLEVILMF